MTFELAIAHSLKSLDDNILDDISARLIFYVASTSLALYCLITHRLLGYVTQIWLKLINPPSHFVCINMMKIVKSSEFHD